MEEAYIVSHIMIVRYHQDEYEGELFELANKAINHGLFISRQGEAKLMSWKTESIISTVISEIEWAELIYQKKEGD